MPKTLWLRLKLIADVFRQGLQDNKLCLIGSVSTDLNTLQTSSCKILEKSIQNTISIFECVFTQGKEDESLRFEGSAEDAAYAYLSFLIGAQIVARSFGGENSFKKSAKTFIAGFTV